MKGQTPQNLVQHSLWIVVHSRSGKRYDPLLSRTRELPFMLWRFSAGGTIVFRPHGDQSRHCVDQIVISAASMSAIPPGRARATLRAPTLAGRGKACRRTQRGSSASALRGPLAAQSVDHSPFRRLLVRKYVGEWLPAHGGVDVSRVLA